MAALRAEFADAGRTDQFETLVGFLNREPEGDRYQAVAERLGVSSGALRMSVHHLCTRAWRNLSMDEWRLYVGESIPYDRTCPGLPPGAGAPGALP